MLYDLEHVLSCPCRLYACQKRATLHTRLPDISGFAAPPDLASVDSTGVTSTAGDVPGSGCSLAGWTCILTEAMDVRLQWNAARLHITNPNYFRL